jgi:hypothetical protein
MSRSPSGTRRPKTCLLGQPALSRQLSWKSYIAACVVYDAEFYPPERVDRDKSDQQDKARGHADQYPPPSLQSPHEARHCTPPPGLRTNHLSDQSPGVLSGRCRHEMIDSCGEGSRPSSSALRCWPCWVPPRAPDQAPATSTSNRPSARFRTSRRLSAVGHTNANTESVNVAVTRRAESRVDRKFSNEAKRGPKTMFKYPPSTTTGSPSLFRSANFMARPSRSS